VPVGVTLSEMVLDLRGELLQSVNTNHGVNAAPAHKRILARIQRTLWLDFAWPHLRVDRDIPMAAGQRYYDFPTDLPLDRVEQVAVKWSGRWHGLERGIDVALYNAYDSDVDIRTDPVLRWAPYEETQFEVWPIPATDGAQTVRICGIRNLRPLVEDADTCDLDSDLIVLTAATELAADAKSQRAAALQSRARQLYAKLTQRSSRNDNGVFVLGGCETPARKERRGPPLVAVDRGN
jgi:hypothetical protein